MNIWSRDGSPEYAQLVRRRRRQVNQLKDWILRLALIAYFSLIIAELCSK